MPARKTWVYSPRKPAKPKIPEGLKARVQAEADRLVEEYYKPQYVLPPPEEARFNYISDIYTKWFRGYLYFCSTYTCPGPNATVPSFESRFTRLEYVGEDRFNVAFMRYTGDWCEVYQGLPWDEALTTIQKEGFFQP